MSFTTKLQKRWEEKLFLCVNLDPDVSKFPTSITAGVSKEEAIFNFNKAIIDATNHVALAYKPNSGFYEAEAEEGMRALKRTSTYIHEAYPDIPVILDAKRGDIEHTNIGYAKAVFDELEMDAVTVSPYLGGASLEPFLSRKDKGVIVLVKTSNPGSGELQDLPVNNMQKLYQKVAWHVANEWNKNGNCAVVVGATYPAELQNVRAMIGDMPILIPGIGAQGGDIRETIHAGKNSKGAGIIIAAGRSIIYASNDENFASAAQKEAERLAEEIRKNL
ncbi:orotidine 5'-phosphate decarboxylase [Candidatus Kaiserbacteria bacterium RIFCSPHIGHO2_01_FULL_48_10]|uniref:Orotidine-5'-phosphate decarboxylase n=1 Tax=Candidatus Kaiserbacteria bacterium RIFCSPHIGHO2_01_FULL_48_10 TaxID=1798476 RepID=A0A1F6C4N8_9BACT|nr:MAG: orotidine 5'-phosphate decarboxylase [Candidatus Kaiserbacteria bacterium RIFCSPHIGHO2_01_FULL_48_10]